MPNQELFDRVLNRISDDPTSFDMEAWYLIDKCGTHACLAGHTILEAGYKPKRFALGHGDYAADSCTGGFIDEVATELLGLTEAQAALMFTWRCIELDGYCEDHAPRNVEELSMRWKAVLSDE